MSKIIESTYKIISKIGQGGGGNVYLAIHLRLGKKVVLKADKRKITTKPELLRREVDILKNLRHMHIPQVYDFFSEDGVVYTVMDYVEGESLDNPLKRGERFSQPQVIRWAVQLLEALCYLHSPTHGDPPRGFVHGDIKPANLMRTPDNNICLIDFNIALALGEENLVGRSPGYSSPEHYGSGYSFGEKKRVNPDVKTMDAETETITDAGYPSKTIYKKYMPDARSDIYSVGATLYHLLSGVRPAEHPENVKTLSSQEFSPLIIHIVSTAMNPDPDYRYQSAEEMLDALLQLRDRDPRVLRLKRTKRIAWGITAAMTLSGVFLTFTGLKRMQAEERAGNFAAQSQKAYLDGDIELALEYALEAMPEKVSIFTPDTIPAVQKALTDALGVYDLQDAFRNKGIVALEKNPLYLSISPNGKTAACITGNGLSVIDIDTLEVTEMLPILDSALSEVEFLDDNVIVYAGEQGLTAYDISKREQLWIRSPATAISAARSGGVIAAVYKDDGCARIYDASSGEQIKILDFGGRHQTISMVSDNFANPDTNIMEISDDGSLLAVSFSDGSLRLFHINENQEELEILPPDSQFTWFEGGFNGKYLAFAAADAERSIFAIIDSVNASQTVALESESSFHTQVDETGIYVQINQILVKMDPLTGEQEPLVNMNEVINQFCIGNNYNVVSANGKLLFFDKEAKLITEMDDVGDVSLLEAAENKVLRGRIDTPSLSVASYIENQDDAVLLYDNSFEHDEARISGDNQRIMLFSYKQFRIYDRDGTIISEKQIPDPDKVYDQQYIRENTSSLFEVTYNDGKRAVYNADTGELVSEDSGEPPDMSLNEVFYTEDYRIEAPLHGTPQVYDKESDRRICELNEDAYLIYVTQTEDYIITQYVTSEGFRYGLLLNNNFETLAYLPYLCDIKDETLYFDYPAGMIKMSEIYNLDYLTEMAEKVDK